MARAVEDFGKAPNWSGSIIFNTAGPMNADTTKSSANLEIIGVREMGRKCLLMTSTGFCLGMGTTSASFQDGGSCCSAKLQLRMEVTG